MCVWGELLCLENNHRLKYGGNGKYECPMDLKNTTFEWTQGENTLKMEMKGKGPRAMGD